MKGTEQSTGMGARGPWGFQGVGWEILSRGVTESALYFKAQSGCCVEIILKCIKSGNKKTTLKAIRMMCARDVCGLGHHFVEWGATSTQMVSVHESQVRAGIQCFPPVLFIVPFVISFWRGRHQLSQPLNLSHSIAFFSKQPQAFLILIFPL